MAHEHKAIGTKQISTDMIVIIIIIIINVAV